MNLRTRVRMRSKPCLATADLPGYLTACCKRIEYDGRCSGDLKFEQRRRIEMKRIRMIGSKGISPMNLRPVRIHRFANTALAVALYSGMVSCGHSGNSCLLCTTSTVRLFAYVVNNGSGNVSAYSVDTASGALAAVPGSPFAAGTSPTSVTLVTSSNVAFTSFPEETVQFAYVVNRTSQSVSAYSIDAASGALTTLPGSPYATDSGPVSMTVVTGFGSTVVEPTGQSTLANAGNFAYILNHDSDNISAYAIDATKGTFVPVPGSPFAAGSGPVALTIAGHFAYVLDNGGDSVSAYSVDTATGALSPVPGSPFATGSGPISLALPNTSGAATYVYVANSGSGDISAYLLDATSGALTPVAGSPFPAGSKPVAVAVGGGFAYVLNQGSNNISAYVIDFSTGTLAAVPGSPFAVGANPVQLTYPGFVYAVNAGSNSVSAFSVSSAGALVPLPGSPYATGSQPAGLTAFASGMQVTPSDHQYFALVPNGGSNNVSAYTLDAPGGQFNGALSAVSGSPFAAGTSPDSAAAITTTVTVPGN